MAHQGLWSTQRRGLAGNGRGLHESTTGIDAARQVEGEQTTHGLHLSDSQFVLGMGGKARVANARYLGSAFEELG
jgi:hypothetical protein